MTLSTINEITKSASSFICRCVCVSPKRGPIPLAITSKWNKLVIIPICGMMMCVCLRGFIKLSSQYHNQKLKCKVLFAKLERRQWLRIRCHFKICVTKFMKLNCYRFQWTLKFKVWIKWYFMRQAILSQITADELISLSRRLFSNHFFVTLLVFSGPLICIIDYKRQTFDFHISVFTNR